MIDILGQTPNITNRNTYNYQDNGNVGTNQYNKAYVIDKLGQTPNITNRNTYNHQDNGNVGTNQYNKPYVIDILGQTPNITNRNTYNHQDNGNIGTNQYNKAYILNRLGITPEPTNRDILKKEHTGILGTSDKLKPRLRMEAENMYTNQARDELTIRKHSPVPVKYMKTPSAENSIMQLCNKIQINRELYPDIRQQNTIGTNPELNAFGGINQPFTRPKQMIPNDQFRFINFPQENLQGNPYINNIIDKSIGVLDYDKPPNANSEGDNLSSIGKC